MTLTKEQLDSIQIAQRTTAVFSLIGCLFVIITFCSSPAFRRPVNRLIFYATFGNIMSAVALLIARQGPINGQDSPLCQLQAFLIQQFMAADTFWSFCMAFNVYLTFYKRYTVAQLRSLEWWYSLVCYGMPTIPSLTMLLVHTKRRERVYGPVISWCSISFHWTALRFACFYAPVWLVSCGSLTIFLRVGHDIVQARRALRRTSTAESANLADFTNIQIQHRSPALRSYLRYSLLFFIAMVVTWIPASVNRIYSTVNPTLAPYPLLFTTALVLPLQGFWNFLIYLLTSFPVCSNLFNAHVRIPIQTQRTRLTLPVLGNLFCLASRAEQRRLASEADTSYCKGVAEPHTPPSAPPPKMSPSAGWAFCLGEGGDMDMGRDKDMISLDTKATPPAHAGALALSDAHTQMPPGFAV